MHFLGGVSFNEQAIYREALMSKLNIDQSRFGHCSQMSTPTSSFLTDLCQYFGHENLRFYAATAIAFAIGFLRSKNASIASAKIL